MLWIIIFHFREASTMPFGCGYLAFLNLIPLPPLDGSKVVSSLLPARQAMIYEKIEPYGFFILVILIFTGILGYILLPLINTSIALLGMIFRL